MAVRAENPCFEFGSMDFDNLSAQDCLFWIEDGFCIQEFQNFHHQNSDLHPFVDSADNLSSSSCFGSLPHEIMQSLSSEIQNQNVEMDHFLQLQNNRFRRSILEEEARKRTATMQRYESRVNALILQKDEEIAMAKNRGIELQHFLKAAEMEAAAWERSAKEREAAAVELSRRLNQMREREADDAASFCFSEEERKKKENDDAASFCKVCHAGICCVVFFPCRHICCCRSCEPLLDHCPLCQSLKESRLQVLFT